MFQICFSFLNKELIFPAYIYIIAIYVYSYLNFQVQKATALLYFWIKSGVSHNITMRQVLKMKF